MEEGTRTGYLRPDATLYFNFAMRLCLDTLVRGREGGLSVCVCTGACSKVGRIGDKAPPLARVARRGQCSHHLRGPRRGSASVAPGCGDEQWLPWRIRASQNE